MTSSKLRNSIALAALMAMSAVAPAFAAQPVSLKLGYFNLALVKASFPEAAGSETLRVQAENMLRQNVEEGNKMLQKMQTDSKAKEDIEKAARQLQTEINAKQQALIQLVQTQQAIANQSIAQAVSSVAKEKGLDLVVDGAGVFAGGEKIVNNGEDITDAIVKKLAPAAIRSTSAAAPEKKEEKAPAGK